MSPKSAYARGSKAKERQSDKLRGGLAKQAQRTARATWTDAALTLKGMGRVVTGEKTFEQVRTRADRKAFKIQTGRIHRKK